MRELREAEAWLSSAEALMNKEPPGREGLTVAVAQSLHAILRANDALTSHFLGRSAKKHDEAPRLFGDLIKQNLIAAEHSSLRDIVTKAAAEKSRYDYHGEQASLAVASRWLRDAKGFVSAVGSILEGKAK